MKGIVLEIITEEAVILSDDGAVSKIKDRNYKIGQEVHMKSKKFNLITKISATAAVLAISAVTGFAYTIPSSYVSLDVNPSIEYSVNAFDRVISVTAVNDDGKRIVDQLEVKNKKITDAVHKTIEKLIKEGYLNDDEYAAVVIAVSNDDEEKAKKLKNDIEEELDEETEEVTDNDKAEEETTREDTYENAEESEEEQENDNDAENTDEKGGFSIIVETVGRERVEEARKLGVTPGKLNLVQKLIKSSDSDDIDEDDLEAWLDKSVKEINKTIKESRELLAKVELDDEEYDEMTEESEEIDRSEETEETNEADVSEDTEETDLDSEDIDKEDDEDKSEKTKNDNRSVKEDTEKISNENKTEKAPNGYKSEENGKKNEAVKENEDSKNKK